MQHFNIIQALCRSALANPSDALIHQINRLKDALDKDGFSKESKSIGGILTSSQANMEMSPSKIQKSFVLSRGEELTPKTPIPVDKETSTPLAEIYFETELPDHPPIFDGEMQA